MRYRVIVDEREKSSGVPDLLRNLGLLVDYRMLEIGDYVISGYAIERKEKNDFLRSLYSGRIFDQAYYLHEAYENPLLIVEGDITPLLDRKIKSRAYWGALTTLTFEYGLNVFFTPDEEHTANLIYTLIKRRSTLRSRRPLVRKKPRIEDLEKTQLFLVSSLPGVGPKLAERILRHFRTVRKVFAASISEISVIKGVGRIRAERIVRFLDASYGPSEKHPQQLQLDPKNLKA